MEPLSETPQAVAKSGSRGKSLVVAGYSTATVALVSFLTINGASGVPGAVTAVTAVLIIVGFVLPILGMLRLRWHLASTDGSARRGFVLQALGLLGPLVGVVLVVGLPTLSSYIVSAGIFAAAGASAIYGAVLLRDHFSPQGSTARDTVYLILGTALLFTGVGIIIASNITFEYLISQVQNTIYVDIGATVSAWGCVVAAYSFFALQNQGERRSTPVEPMASASGEHSPRLKI